jgi:hypothetical protein
MASTLVPTFTFGPTGFVAPTGPAILTGVQGDINAAFGNTLNYNLVTPQGQLAQSWAAVISNTYATFQFFAQQVDPSYASGRMQDAIGRIYLMQRNPAIPTQLTVSCSGATGTVIPFGQLIQDTSQNLYSCATLGGGTIPSGGSINLLFNAVTPGPIAVPLMSRVSIYQTIPGWDSVAVISGVIGQNVEGRAAFELRRQNSVAGNSLGSIGAIIGSVAQVPNVTDFFGINNPNATPLTINGVTIPANAIYISVAGGTTTAVAQAILSAKGAGAPMAGNTTVTAFDSNPLYATPVPYTIIYTVPTPIQIIFNVILVNNPNLPSNATALVQNALIAAATGALGANFTANTVSLSTNITVTNVNGLIGIGTLISGVGIPAGTTIVSQLSGTTGGTGVYVLSTAVLLTNVACVSLFQNQPPRIRIGTTAYAQNYVSAITALGPAFQVSSITIGSINTNPTTFAGTISGNTLTVTSGTITGTIAVNQFLFDSGNRVINGTQIISGSGLSWTVNNPQTVTGATFTGNTSGSSTTITISAVTGTIVLGDLISGAGIPANDTIVSQTSGTTGGAGVYVMAIAANLSSVACTSTPVITAAVAGDGSTVVNANQVPQITAPNITVSHT